MNSSPNSDRSRLARELHDGLAQELVAIGYKLDSVIGRETLDQNSRTELRRLRSTITAVIDQVRNEIFELRNNSDQSFTESTKSQLET
jgi:NarL family two-component system sensor histidine kinase LiaS